MYLPVQDGLVDGGVAAEDGQAGLDASLGPVEGNELQVEGVDRDHDAVEAGFLQPPEAFPGLRPEPVRRAAIEEANNALRRRAVQDGQRQGLVAQTGRGDLVGVRQRGMGHAGGVVDEGLDAFAHVEFGGLFDVVSEFVLEELLQETVIHMQVRRDELEGIRFKDGQGGEALAHGCNTETGLDGGRDILLEVCKSACRGQHK